MNKTRMIVIAGLAFLVFLQTPSRQQASAQQRLTLDEITAIRERAMAGHATEVDKQRLYHFVDQSLERKEVAVLYKWQSLFGKLRGTKMFKDLVETVPNRSPPDPKLLATIDAIIEAEKLPGADAYKQGLKYLTDKQYDLAIQEFDKAVSLGYSSSFVVRGQAWFQKQDYDRAIADFTEVLKTSQNYFDYIRRADAYAHKGDRDSAIADYRRALALNPDEAIKKEINAALERLGVEPERRKDAGAQGTKHRAQTKHRESLPWLR